MNKLYLEKRGQDFTKDDGLNKVSDLQNYRLHFKDLETKDNHIISGNIHRGAFIYKGEKLHDYKLYFDMEYTFSNGCSYRYENDDLKYNDYYEYTSTDLLKAINKIAKIKYDKIEIVENGGLL